MSTCLTVKLLNLVIYMFLITCISARSLETNLNTGIREKGHNTQQTQATREKRTISFATRVLKSVLSGTTVKSSSAVLRKHEKIGDFKTAENDFYSFKPTNVRERNGNTDSWNHRRLYGRVLAGRTGSGHIILREGVKNKPTILEIVHLQPKGQPEVSSDMIYYYTTSN